MEENTEIRRTLQNLLPGTTYATRVRALNEFGQYSDWSEAMEFTAEASASASYTLVAPAAPTIQPQINALTILMNYTFTNDGISSYKLQHSLNNITFSTIATSLIPIYVHQVSPGVTHYYRFTVTDIYGTESPVSPSNSGQSISALAFKPYATVVVAAVNSVAEGAENADFVCDGIDDQITLSAAAVATGSTDGKVLLLEGTYYLSGPITAYAATWEGMGSYSTEIIVLNDISGDLFEGETIRNMYIHGQYNNSLARHPNVTGYVIQAFTAITDVYTYDWGPLTRVAYGQGSITGLYVEDGLIGLICGNACRVSNSYFSGSKTGIEVNAADSTIVGCYFGGSTRGVTFNAEGTIVGSVFDNCSTGILVQASKVNITGNRFSYAGNLANIAIKDYGDSAISGNNFNQCGVEVWSDSNVSGNFFFLQAKDRAFYARSSSSSSFSNNVISHGSHVSAPGVPPIRVDNSVNGTLISGNTVMVYAPTGAFSDAGIKTNYGAGNYINKVWVSNLEAIKNHGFTGATETIDLSDGKVHTVTQDQSCTYTFTAPTTATTSHSFTLVMTAVTGTATWPVSVNWTDGTAPTLSGRSYLTFITIDGGVNWDGFLAGKAMS